MENEYLLNLELIILGDLHFDFLNTTSSYKQYLVKTLQNLNLKQIVSEITRPVSSACLDHINSNHPQRMCNIMTINTGLSDHLPIFAMRYLKGAPEYRNSSGHKHRTFEYRKLKKVNNDAFAKHLSDASWDIAFIFEELEDVVNSWYDIFNSVLDKYAPLTTKRVKRSRQPKWFNDVLNKEIRTRDYLFKKARNLADPALWKAFKEGKK